MTPLHIKLLLHYYAIGTRWETPSPAASDYTQDLLNWGLIEASETSGSGYVATDRGKAHIEGLMRLSLPKWVSPA